MMNSKIQKAEDGKNAGSAKKSVQTGKKVADKKEANKKQAAQVAVFENPEFGTVRTATDEKGEPWFCAKDLCDVLGYKRADNAVRQHVNPSDALKQCVARIAKNRYGECNGKMQVVQMVFVNESGFYALVLGSKLASAVKFKDWVTSVVLPQIRKTGGYIPVHEGESEEETIRNAEEILRATLKKKEKLLAQQRKLIGEQDVEIRRLNGVVDEQVVNIARKGENIIPPGRRSTRSSPTGRIFWRKRTAQARRCTTPPPLPSSRPRPARCCLSLRLIRTPSGTSRWDRSTTPSVC